MIQSVLSWLHPACGGIIWREAWHHMEHGAGRRGIIWGMGHGGVASYGAWGREAWHHMEHGAGRRGIIWTMGQRGPVVFF